MAGLPYKKDWLVSTGIARGLVSTPLGARLPTLNEYCEAFDCSRGVVQNALAFLQQCGAVVLDKRGKQGTFLLEKNEEKLFENAGMSFLTGSMPTPLNLHLAGLATGICQAMGRCSIPFTFAFVQGGQNRVDALGREVYDFVVVTQATAERCMAQNPDIEAAFPLSGCEYSAPYKLYMNRPGLEDLQDGMSMAVDPTSRDQWDLTQVVCAGRNVRLVEMAYISTVQAFLSGEVDSVVLRGEAGPALPGLSNYVFAAERLNNPALVSAVPLARQDMQALQLPVVLVNRKNYGISGILKTYLGGEVVSFVQQKVIRQEMAPQFF